ncbi:MAG: preprotein translocase subunit SecE [Acidobacteria bacterium]|nr:MAG: preprotein translocase subunit SecE [Acidobacteriota bacterium]
MSTWRTFRTFVEDSWKELKRTSWPSRKEVVGTTVVVVLFTVVVAAYLSLVDSILAAIWSLVTSR